jgi:membrane associated rhomboid family serine protease
MRLSGGKPFLFKRSWVKQQRVVLLSLIGANLAAFVAQIFLDTCQPGFVREWLGLSNQALHDAYAWQFITAALLHNGPWHLAGNVLVLYFLGRDLESILGQRHFLYLYVAGLVGGELSHLFLMPVDTILFGASGGVVAVLIAYATVLPELELTSTTFLPVPIRLKAKHLAYGTVLIAAILLCARRNGVVTHSAWLGGCVAGWLYAHLLGFGYPSFLQRMLHERRAATERYRQMSPGQFIAEEVDPLLEKISRSGIQSLTRAERRLLLQAREKVLKQAAQ